MPHRKSEHLHGEELALMSFMAESLVQNDLLAKNIPNTIKMFLRLEEVHKTRSPKVTSNQICSLKPGETFAMFVRRHNSALMIHMPLKKGNSPRNQTDRVIVATFPGNLHPKQMCDNDGDIAVNLHRFFI